MLGETFDDVLKRAMLAEAERVRRAEEAEYARFAAQFGSRPAAKSTQASASGVYRSSPSPSPVAPCLRTLGLDASATADDVRRAFRKLAFAAHPDRGGAKETFVALETAYRAALRVVAHAA